MALDRDTLDRIYRYSYSLTGDEDRAWTLLQSGVERYLKAAQKGPIEAPVPYLRRVVRNIFIDELRRQKRFPEVDLDTLGEGVMEMTVGGLETQVVASMEVQAIWEMLSPMEREVLHLWAVEGYTTREIAEQSDTSRNTILSRIHRIKKKLQTWTKGRDAQGGTAS